MKFPYYFAVAFADPETFPSADLYRALGEALEEEGPELAFYPHPQGHPAMRELLSHKLAKERGMKVSPDHIVLTAGSMQSIVLLTDLFIDHGDAILTEEFLYMGTLRVFNRFRANTIGVGTDEEGMRPDLLESAIQDQQKKGRRVKFIYTVPTFQNPLGTDMGFQRRKDILSISQRYAIPIFEDDCYVDLRFEGESKPAIHALDQNGSIMYCGTSSKIIGPGMRLGWLTAPAEVVEKVRAIHLGATPSQFSVIAAQRYLEKHRDAHVAELTQDFKEKRDVMLSSLRKHFGDAMEASEPPGGMFTWVKLPEGVDTMSLVEKAREQGVRYAPGPIFSPTGSGKNCMRLAFAHMSIGTIREGTAKLAQVFKEQGAVL